MGKFKNLFHHHHHDKNAQSESSTPSTQSQPTSPVAQPKSAKLPSEDAVEKQVLLPIAEEHQSALTDDTNEELPPRSRLAKLMRHDAYRFIAAVLTLGLLLSIAMTLYYYVVPIITKNGELKMRHLGIYEPSDEAFMVHADLQVLLLKNPFNLEIRTITAQLMNGNGKVAGFVKVPSIDVLGSEPADVSMRVPFQIADEQAFESMLVSMIKQEKGELPTLRAVADIRSKRFPALGIELAMDRRLKVPRHKDKSELPFKFDVLTAELRDSQHGLEVNIEAAIESDAPIAVTLPAAKFWLSHDGVQVGEVVTVQPLVVRSGRSVVQLLGKLVNPGDDPIVAKAIGQMVSEYMRGAAPKIVLKGDSTGLDLPAKWMHTALNAVEFPFYLDKTSSSSVMAEVANPLKSVQLGKLHVSVEGNTISLSVAATADLTGNPQMHIVPHEFSANVVLSLGGAAVSRFPLARAVGMSKSGGRKPRGRGGNKPVVPLSTPQSGPTTLLSINLPTQKFTKSGKDTFSIESSVKVTLSDTNIRVIKQLLSQFVVSKDKNHQSVHVVAYYTVSAHVNNLLINMQNKHLEQVFQLPSISSLLSELESNSQPIDDVEIISANEDALKLRIGYPLTGPLKSTEIVLDVGAIPVEILHGQRVIGKASLLDGNAISEKVYVEVTLIKSIASQEFITAFVNGIPTKITIQGDASAQGVRDLFKPFIHLSLPNIPIAGQPQRLLHQVALVSSAKSVWPQAYVTATNPFAVPIHVLAIFNMQVYRSDNSMDTYLTTIDADPIDPPMVIPPRKTSTSLSPFTASYKGDLKDGLHLLPDLLRHKDVRVRMAGVIRVRLGESYELEIPYEQSDVPLSYSVQLGNSETD